MTSSFRSWVRGAVMQARSSDGRHQTLIFYRVFKWKEEPWRPAVISPEHCLIGRTVSSSSRREIRRSCLCVHAPEHTHACVCVCVWMDEVYEWKVFFLSCRQEVRSSCWNGESPTRQPSSHTHQCRLAPILMNPISGQNGVVVATWLMTTQSSISSPPTDRKGCLYCGCWHRHTEVHTHTHKHTLTCVLSSEHLKQWFCCGWLSVNIMLSQSANYLLLSLFTFPLGAELSGFDDWPPIQLCVRESDNE